ncbi:MAG: hypothetical protein DMF71_12145, partial [Acidobacteria bacterium]
PEALKDPNGKEARPAKLKGSRAMPVNIHSAQMTFEQASMRLAFTGGATAEQDRDVMSGDTLTAILTETKSAKPESRDHTTALTGKAKVQKIEVRGNSYLRTMDEGRAAEAHAVDMDFFFDGDQRLQRAVGTRDIRANSLNADSDM